MIEFWNACKGKLRQHYRRPAHSERDPQPEQELEHPGIESQMEPKPDYGYETFRGYGRLEGKSAIITGGDPGIGRALAREARQQGVCGSGG